MKKNIAISLILGTLLSAVTLYLAFRNVPFSTLVSYIASIDYLWMVPAVALALFTFILRTIRWQIILESSKKIPFWNAFHPLMIGFMMNCVLPGRIGELARPVILKNREQVPFTTGLATVAAERAFDLIMLISFFAFVMASVQIDPDLDMAFGKHHLNKAALEAIAGGMLKLSLLLIAGIIVVSIDRTRRLIVRILESIPALFSFLGESVREKIRIRFAGPMIRITENIASGFSLVRYPGKIGLCLGLSFLIWSLQIVSYYLVALGSPGIDLTILEIAAVMIIVCFFIALPSVPGFWGLWEAGGVFALALFGIPAGEAAGFTLANHAAQMFPVIIVGFISAVLTGVNILQISREAEPEA